MIKFIIVNKTQFLFQITCGTFPCILFKQVAMVKVGLLQPGLFIFRRWENFSIVQFIVCWSGSEGLLSLDAPVQGTV